MAEAQNGRPSSYTDEVAEVICRELAEGRSLRRICAAEGMPDRETVMRWVRSNDSFRGQYAQARLEQAETRADELFDIADDGSNDWVKRELSEGVEVDVFDHEHVQRSRLRVDTRKWYLSKLLPKVYGERQFVEAQTEVTLRDDTDRPPRESRDQWIARRARELGVDPRLLGAPAGHSD